MSDRGHCSPVLFTCTSFLSHVSSAKSTFKASRFELSATCSISKRGLYSSCTPAPTHNFICAHGTKKKLYIIYSHTHTGTHTPPHLSLIYSPWDLLTLNTNTVKNTQTQSRPRRRHILGASICKGPGVQQEGSSLHRFRVEVWELKSQDYIDELCRDGSTPLVGSISSKRGRVLSLGQNTECGAC